MATEPSATQEGDEHEQPVAPKVERTKSGKGYRITVVESDKERASRRARRLREFEADASRVAFTRGQAAALRAARKARAD